MFDVSRDLLLEFCPSQTLSAMKALNKIRMRLWHLMATPYPQDRDVVPFRVSLSLRHWLHFTILMVVFGITGILSVILSRFLLRDMLHIDGGLWSGPWSYRGAYLILIPPSYSVILVVVGTFFGKHSYFKQHVLKMWGILLLRRIHIRNTENRKGINAKAHR